MSRIFEDIRLVAGRSLRIIEPDVIEVLLDIGFGVSLTRQVHIDSAPLCPPPLRSEAAHFLVILCGGKDLVVEIDTTEKDNFVSGRIGLRTRNAPPDCAFRAHGDSLLDVGKFLAKMHALQYPVHEARAVLNGPQTHHAAHA